MKPDTVLDVVIKDGNGVAVRYLDDSTGNDMANKRLWRISLCGFVLSSRG